MEIHNDVVHKLLHWNAADRDDRDVDYAFGLALALSLIPVGQIEAGELDNNVLAFITGMLLI